MVEDNMAEDNMASSLSDTFKSQSLAESPKTPNSITPKSNKLQKRKPARSSDLQIVSPPHTPSPSKFRQQLQYAYAGATRWAFTPGSQFRQKILNKADERTKAEGITIDESPNNPKRMMIAGNPAGIKMWKKSAKLGPRVVELEEENRKLKEDNEKLRSPARAYYTLIDGETEKLPRPYPHTPDNAKVAERNRVSHEPDLQSYLRRYDDDSAAEMKGAPLFKQYFGCAVDDARAIRFADEIVKMLNLRYVLALHEAKKWTAVNSSSSYCARVDKLMQSLLCRTEGQRKSDIGLGGQHCATLGQLIAEGNAKVASARTSAAAIRRQQGRSDSLQ